MKNAVSNKTWMEIYLQLDHKRRNAKDPVDVGALLAENNYSPIFEKVDFGSTKNMKNLHFRGIDFVDCNFFQVSFSDTYFTRVNVSNCIFENADWNGVILQDCLFNHCNFVRLRARRSGISTAIFRDSKFRNAHFQHSAIANLLSIRCGFQEADFKNCGLQDVFFSSCNLSDSGWYQCELTKTNVVDGKLNRACFWKNTNQNSSLIDSDLTECVMLENSGELTAYNCTPYCVTKPIVALSWNFNTRADFAPLIARAIRDSGGIPLKVEVEPDEIPPELLKQEIIASLSTIRNKYPAKILSIPSEILKQAARDSEVEKIKSKIATVLQFCSGLAVPGGNDLEPEFYGAEIGVYTDPAEDYRRSVIEFALVHCADQMKLPTMGTCRGAQLINVYFGGTLNQHVDGQNIPDNLQHIYLSASTRKEEFLSYFSSNVLPSLSVHHQAIDKVGKNLEIICEFEGIPKLLLSPDNQFIVSQIHPEIYVDVEEFAENLRPAKCGKLIYNLFFEKVMQFNAKRKK